jgi:hypothetical protein
VHFTPLSRDSELEGMLVMFAEFPVPAEEASRRAKPSARNASKRNRSPGRPASGKRKRR